MKLGKRNSMKLFQEIWQHIWITESGRTQRDYKDYRLYETLQIQEVYHGRGEKTDLLPVRQLHLFSLGRVEEHWGQNRGVNLSSLFVGGWVWRHPRPFLGILIHDPVGPNTPPGICCKGYEDVQTDQNLNKYLYFLDTRGSLWLWNIAIITNAVQWHS